MGQLLLAKFHHFTGEIYPASTVFLEWTGRSTELMRTRARLCYLTSLLTSLRKTGLQTQKAPLASAVISKQMAFFFHWEFKIHKKRIIPNGPAPVQESVAILQRVCSVVHANKGQKAPLAPLEYLHVMRRVKSAGFSLWWQLADTYLKLRLYKDKYLATESPGTKWTLWGRGQKKEHGP